jgi:5-methylcytosine-specific restriction endonuclease McrA
MRPKTSEETKQKIRESVKKYHDKFGVSSATREKISKANKGRKHANPRSIEFRKHMSELNRGSNHPNWKGGIKPVAKMVRDSFKYRQWRSDVFTRDNFTCQECFKRGGDIEAHHNKPFSTIMIENNVMSIEDADNCEELWNINNGKTLCEKCHKKTKTYSYKMRVCV